MPVARNACWRVRPILFGGRFNTLHIVIGETEMMADLMDQDMVDDIAQRLFVLGPVIENGATIERYTVRA